MVIKQEFPSPNAARSWSPRLASTAGGPKMRKCFEVNIQMNEVNREGIVATALRPGDKSIEKFEMEMRVGNRVHEDGLLCKVVVVVDDVGQVSRHFLPIVDAVNAGCLVEPVSSDREQRGVIQESDSSGSLKIAVEKTSFFRPEPLCRLGERETAGALVIDCHSCEL
jgi:hypothetical protein